MPATAARKPAPRASKPKEASSAGQKTRDLILDTAERLFAERGFFGVSVRDITDAA